MSNSEKSPILTAIEELHSAILGVRADLTGIHKRLDGMDEILNEYDAKIVALSNQVQDVEQTGRYSLCPRSMTRFLVKEVPMPNSTNSWAPERRFWSLNGSAQRCGGYPKGAGSMASTHTSMI